MAILVGSSESGTVTLYDVPDSDLSKYALETVELTDDIREQHNVSKETAHGVMPICSPPGSEVEAYHGWCRYWQVIHGVWHTWIGPC